MKTPHTPGPWKHGKTISGNLGVWATPLQYHVLDASAPGIDAEANARLIASAPDLLAALQAVSGKLASLSTLTPAEFKRARMEARAWAAELESARSAIAKAKA